MVQPVLQLVSIAKDASSITLKDGTGIYDPATYPGGYGAPNAGTPTRVGFRSRYWPESSYTGNLLGSDAGFVASLLGAGAAFTPEMFGSTGKFSSGVHHLKYYPLETVATIVTVTKDSTLVTVTAGTAPTAWNQNYLGVVFQGGSKVYFIDRSMAMTNTTFYITEAYDGTTQGGLTMEYAPEADLKILVKEPAINCLVSRIGKLSEGCSCDDSETMELTKWVLWTFSADINFDCMDYKGAHNKMVAVEFNCNRCKSSCSC